MEVPAPLLSLGEEHFEVEPCGEAHHGHPEGGAGVRGVRLDSNLPQAGGHAVGELGLAHAAVGARLVGVGGQARVVAVPGEEGTGVVGVEGDGEGGRRVELEGDAVGQFVARGRGGAEPGGDEGQESAGGRPCRRQDQGETVRVLLVREGVGAVDPGVLAQPGGERLEVGDGPVQGGPVALGPVETIEVAVDQLLRGGAQRLVRQGGQGVEDLGVGELFPSAEQTSDRGRGGRGGQPLVQGVAGAAVGVVEGDGSRAEGGTGADRPTLGQGTVSHQKTPGDSGGLCGGATGRSGRPGRAARMERRPTGRARRSRRRSCCRPVA